MPASPENSGRSPKNNDEPGNGQFADSRKNTAHDHIVELDARMPGLGTRRAALDVMMLLRKGRTLENALSDCRTFNVLEGPDRGFAYNLVSTTLRRRGAMDEIIGQYLDRPLPRNAQEIQDILRLVTAQATLLETPAHAVVATAVELAGQKRETAGYKGLVNAVSRKITDKGTAPLEKLPVRVNTPGWLWRSWERHYGVAHAREIANAHLAGQPPLDLTLKPETDPSLFDKIEGAISLVPGHIRLPGHHRVPDLPGFEDGGWWVQDLAASLPVRLLGDVRDKVVFDLCAAPGGKTLQLAAAGANVRAVDSSGMRLKRVAENLTRTGLKAETIKADVLDWEPEGKADAILLDAPCSATGTIRRHPDVMWNKTEDEVRALARQQSEFIDKALHWLKPGGVLVYCVCSLQREEGEDQARAAMSRHETIELAPIAPGELPGLAEVINREGNLRTLPSMHVQNGGMDGFFACRFRRIS